MRANEVITLEAFSDTTASDASGAHASYIFRRWDITLKAPFRLYRIPKPIDVTFILSVRAAGTGPVSARYMLWEDEAARMPSDATLYRSEKLPAVATFEAWTIVDQTTPALAEDLNLRTGLHADDISCDADDELSTAATIVKLYAELPWLNPNAGVPLVFNGAYA